ncbi:MAG: coproporphyrinogen oxidase [Proteobacteria bacterium]|nr:coproporphyrinogen oxidase [Pseudomonadota bacterium]
MNAQTIDLVATKAVERGALRPPSEQHSLLIRVVRNCPWNKCKFCPAYKGEKFSLRSAEEVIADIRLLAADTANHDFRAAFLQDGDALAAKVDDLLLILAAIHEHLPNIERITAYSRSRMLINRKVEDLRRLKAAGLDRIHVGLESGCDEVLSFMNKGTTYAEQKAACLRVKEAGLELCCYYMPGLGGKRFSEKHALDSCRLISEIAPDRVRLRTCFVLEDTPLADEYLAGNFEPLSEEETVREIRLFLNQLEHTETELISDHRINLLMELRGHLPEDHERLLGIIDRYLALSAESKALFTTGRRFGLIRKLSEFEDSAVRERILTRKLQYQPRLPVPQNMLF